jgi:hypothetical protein
MWSDVVLQIERVHLLRLLFWGGASTVAGTGLLVIAYTQGHASAVIRRFALVCALFGGWELILGAVDYHELALRDLSGATRLERLAWMELGLFLGMIGVGATMAIVARAVGPRVTDSAESALPWMGAGIAVVLHGAALATLELLLLAALSR